MREYFVRFTDNGPVKGSGPAGVTAKQQAAVRLQFDEVNKELTPEFLEELRQRLLMETTDGV